MARGANTCWGSGKNGSFSPGAAARMMALSNQQQLVFQLTASTEKWNIYTQSHSFYWDLIKNEPSSCLRNSITSSLQNSKCTLIAHRGQTTKRKLQNHAPLEGHEIAHIFQQEKSWTVVITVTQVGGNQGILQQNVQWVLYIFYHRK